MLPEQEGAMTQPRVPQVIESAVLATLSCSLPPAGADARRIATAALFEKATACEWIEDGARVHFDGSTEAAQAVLDFVLVERRCCSQLSYQIETQPPHDRIALVLRGPSELRDAIRGWVGEER
jgi:hypothetical protein